MYVFTLYIRMRKQLVPVKDYHLDILLGDLGLEIWVLILRTTFLEAVPSWERP